jgi:hypothetical protein
MVLFAGLMITATAMADYKKFGEQQFSSAASEKYGVRGWYRQVDPYVGNASANFSVCRVCIAAEVGPNHSMVECGYYKGYGRIQETEPTKYWGYCPSADPNDYWEAPVDQGVHIVVGSLHKYAVSQTGEHSNGDFEWTFYFDGEARIVQDTPHPGCGHAECGGEIYCSDTSVPPHMNAQGRNNGTSGDSCYWCYKNSDASWHRWTPTNCPNTEKYIDPSNDGITFTWSDPKYSNFDATGE